MDFNFDFWLQAFVRFVTGQCDTPPVPPPHMRPKEPPKPQPAAPKQEPPQTPPIAPDNDTLKPEDIYMIPRLPENGENPLPLTVRYRAVSIVSLNLHFLHFTRTR